MERVLLIPALALLVMAGRILRDRSRRRQRLLAALGRERAPGPGFQRK